MKATRYNMLTQQYHKTGKPFLVLDYIAEQDKAGHVFLLQVGERSVVLGLPARRNMIVTGPISEHISRTQVWKKHIQAGELTWRPIRLDGKRNAGRFQLGSDEAFVDAVAEMVMPLPKKKPAGPTMDK